MTWSFISIHHCTILYAWAMCVFSFWVIRNQSALVCGHVSSSMHSLWMHYFISFFVTPSILSVVVFCHLPESGWLVFQMKRPAGREILSAGNVLEILHIHVICQVALWQHKPHATVVHMNFKGPILCPIFGSFHLRLQWWMIELIICRIYHQHAKILCFSFLLKTKLCSQAWKGGHTRGSHELVPEGGVHTCLPAHCHAVRETQLLPPVCLSEQLAVWLTAAVKGSQSICTVCMPTPDQEHAS